MAFASGQRVTAASLNRITRNDLEAVVTSDQAATTSEVDLNGATLNVTTIQPNTKLKITASIDGFVTGTTDIPRCTLVVDGAVQSGRLKFQGVGGGTFARTWTVIVPTAKTLVVKLTLSKVNNANTAQVAGTHSNLVVSGNGIS